MGGGPGQGHLLVVHAPFLGPRRGGPPRVGQEGGPLPFEPQPLGVPLGRTARMVPGQERPQLAAELGGRLGAGHPKILAV